MAQGLIEARHLTDIANAIRVKRGTVGSYSILDMPAAISVISGTLSGTIERSTDTTMGAVYDADMTNIADAIRAKLNTYTQYTPAQMADAILSITSGGGGVTIVPWATGTDAEVGDMIDAAQAGTIDLQQDGGWAVGDVRTIPVSAFSVGGVNQNAQNIDIVISSFDEYMGCGNVMQFDFKCALTAPYKMNNSSANDYENSTMKTLILPALANALPSWLASRLIEFSVLVTAGNASTTVNTVTGNKLALRSEIEIFGTNTYSIQGEGSQIGYYATSDNRMKKRGRTGSNDAWWQRSPYYNNYMSYCDTTSRGAQNFHGATSTSGTAPFGCL